MTMPALNARRPTRLPFAKHGQVTLFQETPLLVDVEPTQPVLTVFERLAKKNPAFTQLVDALDLIEVWSTTPNGPTPLPELPEPVVVGPVLPRLTQLAQQAFKPNQTYTRAQATKLLATLTNVTPDRAGNGLIMMQQQNLIALTLSNEFYLTSSTPF